MKLLLEKNPPHPSEMVYAMDEVSDWLNNVLLEAGFRWCGSDRSIALGPEVKPDFPMDTQTAFENYLVGVLGWEAMKAMEHVRHVMKSNSLIVEKPV